VNTPVGEIVLAMGLEPSYWRQSCDDLRVVLSAQPDAGLTPQVHRIGPADRYRCRIEVELRAHGRLQSLARGQ